MVSRKKFKASDLSRREHQIMMAVYRHGSASVAEIVSAIPDPPTADAVRRLCHILEEKGHLKSRAKGHRRVYEPTVTRGRARRHALEDVVDTFFAGSPRMLVATLLDTHGDKLSPEDIERLNAMIEGAEET